METKRKVLVQDLLNSMKGLSLKIVATDLDVTYAPKAGGKIPRINKEAFWSLKEKEIIGTAVTGRQLFTTKLMMEKARVERAIVNNGAEEWRFKEGNWECLYYLPIAENVAAQIVQRVFEYGGANNGIYIHLSTPEEQFLVEEGYIDKAWEIFYPQPQLKEEKAVVKEFSSFSDLKAWGISQKVTKVGIVFKDLTLAEQFKQFLSKLNIRFWEGGFGKFEIGAVGTGKSSALKRMIRRESRMGNPIHHRQVLFFGDNWNDLEALMQFSGICVGDAPEELKKALPVSIPILGPGYEGTVGKAIKFVLEKI